ncbi:MAG: ferrous iron transport protein A [Peptococcaceae bacterium]|jgi:ferrous iron transport protein A|nr:ferrous iron transport protein A [Peptococcaceae bacterium]
MTELSALKTGRQATVDQLHVSGLLRRRILDLGIIPGVPIVCRGRAPSGDPIAYQVRGTIVALRKADAGKIFVDHA